MASTLKNISVGLQSEFRTISIFNWQIRNQRDCQHSICQFDLFDLAIELGEMCPCF